jgi:O-antigen/teichoic acid export membrane protein
MTNTALSITNILINSILPDFVRYHSSKEKEKLYSVFNANWFFSGLIVNSGIILIIPFAEIIFKTWTKGIITFDFNLFISLAASISVINFGAGFYNYLFAINSLRAITLITITRVIILFIFSYYLSGLMGLSGIGAAVLISEIFSSMILPYFYVQKILKSFDGSLDIKSSITAAAAPLIIISLAAFQLFGIKFNYYIWGAYLFLIIIIYMFNWIILDKEVKERTLHLVRNLF